MQKPAGSDSASPFKTRDQKAQEREAKRDAVLLAAVRLFNERGFHATSLDDVAASLGISKPTIYHYLGNKNQVLLECVRVGLDQLLEAAEEARRREGTGFERLVSFLIVYAQINMNDFGRCTIRSGEEVIDPQYVAPIRQLKRDIHYIMRDIIEVGVEDGSIRADNPNLLAFTLAGALNWPARWYDPDSNDDPEETARAIVGYLAHGFAS